MNLLCSVAAALVFLAPGACTQSELKIAHLGDLSLESGGVLQSCFVGYRTFGKLNQEGSNAVLFPTWFGGRSVDLERLIGPANLVDSDRFFVIAVDALGDGVSSSPSTSPTQPDAAFPSITIRDMVRSQYRLVTEELGLKHLFAVVGGSMGGMQTFEWVTLYPDFVDRAVPYVGSPQLTSRDLLLWQAEMNAIDEGHASHTSEESIRKTVAAIQSLELRTPAYVVRETKREEMPEFLAATYAGLYRIFDSYNWKAQLGAMMAHDVAQPYGGSLEKAAARVKAKLLVVVASQDHVVNPEPALAFAGLARAQVVIMDNDCGHLAPECDMKRFVAAVSSFLTE
jgi:homoserine O-acetyltransferase